MSNLVPNAADTPAGDSQLPTVNKVIGEVDEKANGNGQNEEGRSSGFPQIPVCVFRREERHGKFRRGRVKASVAGPPVSFYDM
jgi:hypothetical protein